jgi:hypothetical protein
MAALPWRPRGLSSAEISARLLRMRFEEPGRLVEIARNGGEDIRRVCVVPNAVSPSCATRSAILST